MNESQIFAHALKLATPEARSAYLAETCAGDDRLRADVEALLRAYDNDPGYLEQPAGTLGATLGSQPVAGLPTGSASGPGYPEPPGTIVAGRYKLLEVIGEGGMGTVYLAEQTAPVRRKVALKVIKVGMDSRQVLARFEAERQALALMDHPNIAKVLDAEATEQGRPFFVMELVKGVPITTHCDQKRLTPRERLELFVPVCQAVQHAHQKGIIHRDLKPSNVLVGIYDGVPVPKVIDFGVAKAAGPKLTEATLFTGFGTVIGTPEYMSPEQAQLDNIDIDTRSDIHSLGVLLYELLTGTTPFTKADLEKAGMLEMLRVIREQEPTKPSTKLSTAEGLPTLAANRGTEPARLAKLVRGELDWIVMKALEKDRTRRYETASAFTCDIERYLNDEPVEAGPPSAAYKLTKYALKHRVGLATAAAFALLLMAATAISSWLAFRATRAEGAALRAYAAEAEQRKEAVTQRDRAIQAEYQAKEEEKKARQSESEANAVLKFFQEQVLSAARPEGQEGGLGKDVTIRKAIDAAEPKIAGSFKDQLTIEASIRNTLGLTYRYLGEPALAIRQHERALELRKARVGSDHPDTLESRNNLATAYLDAGRTAEAIAQHQETLNLRTSKLGRDDPDTLTSRNNLAAAYWDAGRTAEAIAQHQETLKLRIAKLGPDHPDTLQSRNNLAASYRVDGRTADAIALHEETIKLYMSKLGPDHPDTLMSRNNLAVAYVEAGRTDEAIKILGETLKLRTTKQGPDHPDTLLSRNNLAFAYMAAGRTTEAIPLHEENLELRTMKLGPDHPHTLQSRNNLALAYMAAGRTAEAIPLHEENLRLQIAKQGPDHPNTLTSRNNLARAYNDAGLFAKSEPILRECLATREKTQPDDWVTFHTRSQLGGSLLGQKRFAEAEPLILQGYEGLKARAAKIPAPSKKRLTEAAERVVKLYDAWGKPDQATRWRRELESEKAEAKPPDP